MDKNSEANVNHWVSDRLTTLNPDNEWHPDVKHGFERLNARHKMAWWNRGTWALVAVAAAAACVCLLIFPTSRETIYRPWERNSHLGMVNVGRVSADVKIQSAPDFVLKDYAGSNIRLSNYEGNVVVLNFWATWCSACKVEIPWLIEFADEHKSDGLTVIGVSMDADSWAAVKPFEDEEQINYPVVIGNASVAESYGIIALPMTLLIGRDGRISAASVGILDKNACEAEIVRLLKQ
jgi:peroxiredoxin